MSERKSGRRARKTVDYAKFGGDETDDDDFRDSTPPVAKKAKISNKENETKREKNPSNRKDPKARKTVEEKMFEQELQAALELSMSQSDPSQESVALPTAVSTQATDAPPTAVSTQATDAPPNIVDDLEDNRAPSPILPPVDHPPVLLKSVPIESDIEVLNENVKDVPSKRGRTTKPKKYVASDSESGEEDFEVDLRQFLRSPLTPKVKRKQKTDDDSDFAPGAESDTSDGVSDEGSDNDFNADDDSDSDFGSSKPKKGKKVAAAPKPTKPKPAPKTSNVKTTNTTKAAGSSKAPAPKTAKPAPARTAVKPQLSSRSPAVSSRPSLSSPSLSSPTARAPALGLTKKTPNWTPPAPSGNNKVSIGGGASLRSPSTGLRIGLSRNMKLKPLHPNVKMGNS